MLWSSIVEQDADETYRVSKTEEVFCNIYHYKNDLLISLIVVNGVELKK